MTTQIKPPQGAITAVLVVFCGPLRGLPYIYLPSVSVFAVASLLLLDRFQSPCSANGPNETARRAADACSTIGGEDSSNPRRMIVLVALLVAAKTMLLAEGFREGFAKAFRAVPPTVTQTVSVVLG